MTKTEETMERNKTSGDADPLHPPVRKKSNLVLNAIFICIILAGFAVLFFGPGIGLPVGICGADTIPMTYSSTVIPTYTESLLHEFGEAEPDSAFAMPPLLDYLPKKDAIDTLMARTQVSGDESSVIGMYEFPSSSLLLVTDGTDIIEILADNGTIKSYTLVPRDIGSRSSGTAWSREAARAAHPYDRTYISLTEGNETIRRIDLVLPGTADTRIPFYIVNKTRTDTFNTPDGSQAFSVTTTGTFFVIYGKRVERATYGSDISHTPYWIVCSDRTGFTRNGTTGELRHTVKLARSGERVLVAYLTVTSPWIQVAEGNIGSSMSQWNSRDSSGCSC